MKILAFDTSSSCLSVAVVKDGKVLAHIEDRSPMRHSAILLPSIDQALLTSKLKLNDIDVLALGLGPGSFTGLRVGVATAKMLAFGSDLKLVGISSLEAYAREKLSLSTPNVVVMTDARKGQVYAAWYQMNGAGALIEKIAPCITEIDSFVRHIKGSYVEVGYKSDAEKENLKGLAPWIAQAAMERAQAKKFITAEKLEPMYLHAKDCNVMVKKNG